MSQRQGAAAARLKVGVLVGAAAALIVAGRVFPIQEALRDALAWVAGLGAAGIAAFIVIYILGCVLMLPGSVLTLGAGAVFGVVKGTAVVSLASTLGATAAFLVGRHLARAWVAHRVAAHPRFAAIDAAVGREGWKIVGLTRLSPVFPFNLLNYAYGLTSVGLRDYVVASWIGMFPGTVMYVYLGSLAGGLATLGAPGGGRTPGQWALFGVGLAATVAVTVLATRIARQALARRL